MRQSMKKSNLFFSQPYYGLENICAPFFFRLGKSLMREDRLIMAALGENMLFSGPFSLFSSLTQSDVTSFFLFSLTLIRSDMILNFAKNNLKMQKRQ